MSGALVMPDEETVYTPEEVARIIRVHPRTVYRMIESGKLKAFPVGNRSQRIKKSDLDRLMDNRPREDKGE
jgi:excisionase family DNA binding protein